MREVSPGNYTFETRIVFGGLDSLSGQEFSYHVIGHVDNRSFEFYEYNIPADIDWKPSETASSAWEWIEYIINGDFLLKDEDSDGLKWYMVLFWIVLLVVIIVSVIVFVRFTRKRKEKDDPTSIVEK